MGITNLSFAFLRISIRHHHFFLITTLITITIPATIATRPFIPTTIVVTAVFSSSSCTVSSSFNPATLGIIIISGIICSTRGQLV